MSDRLECHLFKTRGLMEAGQYESAMIALHESERLTPSPRSFMNVEYMRSCYIPFKTAHLLASVVSLKWAVPSDLMAYKPAWSNFFENPTTVQFVHRILVSSITDYFTPNHLL